ncbi:MAG: FAD:protein FMN transferase [Microbacteriaceae bacterium]
MTQTTRTTQTTQTTPDTQAAQPTGATHASPSPTHRWTFDAIGTPWSVDTVAPLSALVRAAVSARIDSFDRSWSRFRDDSLVRRIAERPGSWQLPADAAALLAVYRDLYKCTDGAVSPLIGRTLEQLGYDRTYSLRDSGRAAAPPEWDAAISWDGETLTTVAPVVLDVGAAGKGYLVDLVCGVLREAGETDFVVDASGDLRIVGSGVTRVALEHPRDASKAIGVANLSRGALAASASNRRAWGAGLHHVIDATTGLPTSDVIATWAMAPTALLADGLATGLFFAEAQRFARFGDFGWVRMFANGRVQHSADFPGEFFA